jgi:hypothetical protein
MDVLMAASGKDIDDWVTLSKQLVEDSFKDAEAKFLSSVGYAFIFNFLDRFVSSILDAFLDISKSPITSPRLDVLPEELDRVSRIKALLRAHQDGTIPKPKKKRAKPIDVRLKNSLMLIFKEVFLFHLFIFIFSA